MLMRSHNKTASAEDRLQMKTSVDCSWHIDSSPRDPAIVFEIDVPQAKKNGKTRHKKTRREVVTFALGKKIPSSSNGREATS